MAPAPLSPGVGQKMYFQTHPGPTSYRNRPRPFLDLDRKRAWLPNARKAMDDQQNFPGRKLRITLSLILVALLILHSSWFFAAMCFMALAMVISAGSEDQENWLTWMGMLVGFALFAGIRAEMKSAVEARPLFLYVIDMETLGGLIPPATNWLQEVFQSGPLDAFSTATYLSYFVVPQLIVIYLWRKKGPFRRFVASACLLFAGALVIHFILPTAPPWMAADVGLLPKLDRICVRVMASISPGLTAGGYQASGNDVAAMPSVHQGLTVLAMLALSHHKPETRWIGWTYSALMLFAITYLGEHYAADGVVGAGMAWGSWVLVGSAGQRRGKGGP